MSGKTWDKSIERSENMRRRRKPLFDVIIGNPPYQDDKVGDARSMPPIYDKFMKQSFEVASKVELITPARFLFNAGATPKQWNRERLDDPHFKVLRYEPDTGEVFNNVVIKGGVAITYRDADGEYEPIGTFVPYPELRSILGRVESRMSADDLTDESLSSIITGRGAYRLSREALSEHPNIALTQSEGHSTDIGSGAFDLFDNMLFFENKPDDGDEYIRFYGLFKTKRAWRWIKRRYIVEQPDFNAYKVIIQNSNGSGSIGDTLSTPLIGTPIIGTPLIGYTETFIAAGPFDTLNDAEACMKYVKTRFARIMLGVLKVTQSNTRDVWARVPTQDFTTGSVIDWSQPIHDIDHQLYEKYGLDEHEIGFIEDHVKKMS